MKGEGVDEAKSMPCMIAVSKSREGSYYLSGHPEKINSLKDDLEPVEKIATDLKKGSVDLKSLEENKTSKNCLMQEPEMTPKMCGIHNIFWDLNLS